MMKELQRNYSRGKKYLLNRSVCLSIVAAMFVLGACQPAFELPFGKKTSAEEVADTMEGEGFDTPEAAAIAYLEGFRDEDVNRMISTFAIETYVQNYDFEALLERVGVYTLAMDVRMPNSNEYSTDLNIQVRRNQIANSIVNQYLVLCGTEGMEGQIVRISEDGGASKFAAGMDRAMNRISLENLEILGFIPPKAASERYSSGSNRENLRKSAAICGADKRVSVIAAFQIGRKKYMQSFDALEYNGKWYIAQLGGNVGSLMGLSVMQNGLVPLDEFPEMVAKIEPYEVK